MEVLNAPLDALQAQVSTNMTAITNLGSEVSTLQSEVASIQTWQTQTDTEIDALQDSIDSINSSVSAITADVASIHTDINNINSNITAMSAQLSSLNSQVSDIYNTLSEQNAILADHERRIQALEGTQTFEDPYVGALVHLRDGNNKCQPAVVYEDWKALNQKDTVSVVVVAPYRLSVSEWNSKIEVQKEPDSTTDLYPYSYWHWPEKYYDMQQIPGTK